MPNKLEYIAIVAAVLNSSLASANLIVTDNLPPVFGTEIFNSPELEISDIRGPVTKPRVANRFFWEQAAVGMGDIHLEFWGGFRVNSTITPVMSSALDFRVRIYDGNNAAQGPQNLLGEYNFSNVSPTFYDFGNIEFLSSTNYYVNEYNVALSGIGYSLAGNTQYWVEIVDNDIDSQGDPWGWVATSAPFRGYHTRYSDSGNWVLSNSLYESRAFRVTAVPEPGSFALLGLVSVVAAGRFRKRKTQLNRPNPVPQS